MKINSSPVTTGLRAVFTLVLATAFLSSFLARPAAAADVWVKTLSETFDTDAAAGKVATKYVNKMVVYHDSDKYRSSNLSVHHGKLDVNLKGGAAFYFRPTPKTKGQTYGRFKIKFKVTGGFGYSAAFQLWPIAQPGESSHDAWSRGEIDFPEGRFGPTRQIFGFHHTTTCTPGCQPAIRVPTGETFMETHTTEIVWTPRSVSYYIDGRLLTSIDKHKPVGDHRFTVQSGADSPDARPGHLYIYSVAQYALKS